MRRFSNRTDAGLRLAASLDQYAGRDDVVVFGLARGGVVVAAAVAAALDLPLDVLLVRKLGVPGHEELAMGAIASGGVRVLNDDVIRSMRIGEDAVAEATRRELTELQRREVLYRGGRLAAEVRGRVVLLVDDGLATGASMRAAVTAVRALAPAKVVVAVPIASHEARDDLARVADEVVCLALPDPFWGVGAWYDDFSQTSDDEVATRLRAARRQPPAGMMPS